MDKILRIDVGAEGGPKATVEPVGRYASLGGRALTSTLISEEVDPKCDPLGSGNKLVISPGILAGTLATTSGRLSIGCKSPLTGGIKEANSGGQGGQYLARLGYAAVVIEGERKGDDLYKIYLDKEGVTIVKCNELKMLGNYAVAEKIKAEYSDKVALLCIGQAGEQLLANSTVAVTDPEFRPSRHAARGGVGAVFGSKGIKAFVVDGAGLPNRQPVDAEGFKEANRKLIETIRASELTGKSLPVYGTAMISDVINEVGGYPGVLSTQGTYAKSEAISGAAIATLQNERGGTGCSTHGCQSGCVVKCSGIFSDKDGNYVTKQPEYESVWALGGNCDITDLDDIARLDYTCDDLGIDTMESGCTIGIFMQSDELNLGDAQKAIELLKEIGKGTEKGRLVGSGTATVAKKLGVKRAPVVKGQSMAGYDPRGIKGMGVTYATSPMGADHTAGSTLAHHFFNAEPKVDALSAEGQMFPSALNQIATAAFDSTGFCLIVGFAGIDKLETTKYLLATMSTFTGLNYTETGFAALGIRILRMEIDFNRRAGFTAKDDRLPEWMTTEPLPPHNTVFDVPDEDLDAVHQHTKLLLSMLAGKTLTSSPLGSLFGAGCHEMIPDNLAAMAVTKPLIVTDKGIVQAGILKTITDLLDAKFFEYAVYDGTQPNPSVENINAGVSIYRSENCNGLISLGGGSAHDCCKGIGVLATNPGTIHDYEGLYGVFNMGPPMIAVTTSSGTGSEVTFGAVISDTKRHVKMLIVDPKMTPLVAVNDPLLTRSMPPHITAGTGMDALTHAIEGYMSPTANPFSDGLNEKAIRLIVEYLPKAVDNGDDLDARLQMCYAQYNAGLSLNSAMAGNAHSVAHSLGAIYDLPHGDCNAIMLPHVMRMNASGAAEKLAEVARLMGVDTTGLSDAEAAEKAAQAVETLNRRISIPVSVTELCQRFKRKADRADIPELIRLSQQDIANMWNPVVYSTEDYQTLIEKVWG